MVASLYIRAEDLFQEGTDLIMFFSLTDYQAEYHVPITRH
jgi:hypothetical protein